MVCTWFWGEKYPPDDVRKLAAGVRRNLQQPHKFFVVTDVPGEFEDDQGFYRISIDDRDADLLEIKGCFARLRMFDPQWQGIHQLRGATRIACIDLDTVITGPLDPLFDRPEPFVILKGANSANPCPYNGSCFMLRAGAHPEVWSDFTLEKAQAIPFYEYPDDQAWLAHKIPKAAGWKAGSESGLCAFQKPGWPKGDALPNDARMVVFPGWRSPEKFKHLDWVQQHWRK